MSSGGFKRQISVGSNQHHYVYRRLLLNSYLFCLSLMVANILETE
jgi:hypothetical protein